VVTFVVPDRNIGDTTSMPVFTFAETGPKRPSRIDGLKSASLEWRFP
jgi:hypothetical protein